MDGQYIENITPPVSIDWHGHKNQDSAIKLARLQLSSLFKHVDSKNFL